MDFDWLVIGSGFGGSVSALRLAEKGHRVGVLECGRRFADDELPTSTWDVRRYWWLPRLGMKGIFRLTIFKDVAIASGSGVGGGSLGYANTLYRAPVRFYEDRQWAELNNWQTALAPHYERPSGCWASPPTTRTTPPTTSCASTPRRSGWPGPTRKPASACTSASAASRSRTRSSAVRAPTAPAACAAALHGGVPARRQEHAGQELPVVRGARGHADHARAHRGRHPAARRGGRQRRLHGHHRTLGRVAAARPTDPHRQGRRRRRGRAGHEPPAPGLPPERLAAEDLPRLGELVRTNSEAILAVTLPEGAPDVTRRVAITGSIYPDPETHIETVVYGDAGDGVSGCSPC